jgi:hypothetical protein
MQQSCYKLVPAQAVCVRRDSTQQRGETMPLSIRDVIRLAPMVLVVGCATRPSVPIYPTAIAPTYGTSQETVSAAEARYKVGDVQLSQYQRTLLLEKSYAGVLAQLRAHQAQWQSKAEEIDGNVDDNGNLQFGAAALGGLGILLGSPDVGKLGAGVAGGAGVYANHYQLTVQADNYRRAADAVQCMYKRIAALPESFWNSMYTADGEMKEDKEYYTSPHHAMAGSMAASAATKAANPASAPQASADAQRAAKEQTATEAASQGYDTLAGLWFSIHDALLEIRKRLAASQRATRLAAPSSTEIATALQQKADNKDAASTQGKSLQDAPNTKAELAKVAAPSGLPSAQVLQQAIQLPKDLDACVALIGAGQ